MNPGKYLSHYSAAIMVAVVGIRASTESEARDLGTHPVWFSAGPREVNLRHSASLSKRSTSDSVSFKTAKGVWKVGKGLESECWEENV